MKKVILILIFSITISLSLITNGYAEICFDVEKVIWNDKAIFDTKNNIIHGPGNNYDWSQDEGIPTIDAMPEPNITVLTNGYITKINKQYYWAGRKGNKNSPLPIVPLGVEIPNDLSIYSTEYLPDLFPYNSWNINIKYETPNFNDDILGLKYAYGDIARWVFGWNGSDKTFIFVNGINCIETNLTFDVNGHPMLMKQGDFEIIFWEDDTTFYIKNYNILLKTPKQPLYDALSALEDVPKVKYNNQILAFEQPPVIENDYTLVPIRFLFEQMGAEVTWNQETKTATITQDNTAITFGIDDTNASVNGSNVSMDIPARLINGKTMVPVRFLSEELGYNVDWDGENRIITIE